MIRRAGKFLSAVAFCFALALCAAPSYASRAYAAEADGFALECVLEERPYYFERGKPFDFSDLPDSFRVRGTLDGAYSSKYFASVRWNVTERERLAAAAFSDFTLNGVWTEATNADGTVVRPVATSENQPSVDVRFRDRCAPNGFSVAILPIRSGMGGTGKLLGLIFQIKVRGGFDPDAETDLEYSDGSGFRSIPISDGFEYEDTAARFTGVVYRYAEEGVVDENTLSSFLTDRYFYRLNVKTGLFRGISNTVTIEGENVSAPEEPAAPDDSGILDPAGDNGGSRGGGTSFWATPSGTAAGVGVGIAVVIASIGIGFGVSILATKRKDKKKHEKTDV